MQLMGCLVIGAWVAGFSIVGWFALRLLKILRVSEAAEKDLFHHTIEMAKFTGSTFGFLFVFWVPRMFVSHGLHFRCSGHSESKAASATSTTEISHMQSRASKAAPKEAVVVIDDDSSTGSESD
jgi:hypothetical protein